MIVFFLHPLTHVLGVTLIAISLGALAILVVTYHARRYGYWR
ncbi:MAG: hypothetical protein AAB074_15420 [Planctomycetota bacterium]